MRKSLLGALSLLFVATAGAQNDPGPATTTAAEASARAASDQDFVRKASAAGLAEVAEARKALQMSRRDDVRRAAQQILNDHEASNAKLKALAQAKNLQLSTQPKPSPPAAAGDFDTAYIASQIQAHEEAIALFRSQARDGRDSELKNFATETLPTLEKHLSMVQGLKK